MTDTDIVETLVIALARASGLPENVIWYEIDQLRQVY